MKMTTVKALESWEYLEIFDNDDNEVDGDTRLEMLRNYRDEGSMPQHWFAFGGLPHEIEDDPSTWGPRPTDIDWSGLD